VIGMSRNVAKCRDITDGSLERGALGAFESGRSAVVVASNAQSARGAYESLRLGSDRLESTMSVGAPRASRSARTRANVELRLWSDVAARGRGLVPPAPGENLFGPGKASQRKDQRMSDVRTRRWPPMG
jgi:hypothetical protein